MGFFSRLFGRSHHDAFLKHPGMGLEELATRMRVSQETLNATAISYRELHLPKRDGKLRLIHAPDAALKTVQRAILRRVLGKLSAHPAAMGFEPGKSIVTNARPHLGAKLIVKLDIRDFFNSTTAPRVSAYFRAIGWSGEVAALLARLTTYKGSLPQGAPTSPRLSNLVNYQLDVRLFARAMKLGAIYTRYADDITFSLGDRQGLMRVQNPKTLQAGMQPVTSAHRHAIVSQLVSTARSVAGSYGYKLNTRKFRVATQHDRMLVTGIVVNEKLNLPRDMRRRMRAAAYNLAHGKETSLSAEALRGWQAFAQMVAAQS
jgi:retron-type reverse transcriptase